MYQISKILFKVVLRKNKVKKKLISFKNLKDIKFNSLFFRICNKSFISALC